jgi:hypothetical protein
MSLGSIPSEEDEAATNRLAGMKDGPDGVVVTKWREDELVSLELKEKIILALSNSLLAKVSKPRS